MFLPRVQCDGYVTLFGMTVQWKSLGCQCGASRKSLISKVNTSITCTWLVRPLSNTRNSNSKLQIQNTKTKLTPSASVTPVTWLGRFLFCPSGNLTAKLVDQRWYNLPPISKFWFGLGHHYPPHPTPHLRPMCGASI